MKILHIFEHSDEINISENITNHCLLGINPSAQAKLFELGLDYYSPKNFFNVEGHKSVCNKSKEIMDAIYDLFLFKDEHEIQESYKRTLNFNLRCYLNYLLSITFIIQKTIKTINPKKIYVYKGTNISEIQKTVSYEDRIVGHLVKKFVKSNNLNIEIIENTFLKKKKKQKELNFTLKRIFIKLGNFFYKTIFKKKGIILITSTGYNLFNFSKKVQKKFNNDETIFLLESYSKKFIIRNLLNFIKLKVCPFPLIDENEKAKKNKNIDDSLKQYSNKIINLSHDTKSILTFYGVDLSNELKIYINFSAVNFMNNLNIEIKNLTKLLKLKKPKIILSQMAYGIDYAVGEYCRKNKIPAMLISHASHVLHVNDDNAKNEWDFNSLILQNTDYPFVAAQTPFAKKFLENQINLKSKIITTGPLILKSREKKMKKNDLKKNFSRDLSNKFVILHASTPKDYYTIRPWTYETDDEYVNNLNDLISSIKNSPNVFLIIKFRPKTTLNYLDLKKLLIKAENYKVVISDNLEKYLSMSDVLISYSSTVIEEAINFYVPIILYDPQSKYSHLPSYKILSSANIPVKPVYFCDNSSNLLPLIKKIDKLTSNDITVLTTYFDNLKFQEDKTMTWLDQVI